MEADRITLILSVIMLCCYIAIIVNIEFNKDKQKNKHKQSYTFAVVVEKNTLSITSQITGVDTSKFRIGDIVYFGEKGEIISAEEYENGKSII